jgi:hypothetical protein
MLSRIRRDEGGYVLVVVLLSMILVLSLITGVMNYAIGARDLSARDQSWNAALAAAEAGVDDYLFRLNQQELYWQYSAANPPPDGNQAFVGWVPVPGDETGRSFFRYDVFQTPIDVQTGAVVIKSTGKVANVTRTIETTLRKRGFLDYLYFTDIESTDPALYPNGFNSNDSAWAVAHGCDKHYYDGRDVRGRTDFPGDVDTTANDYCTDQTFPQWDVIDGPLHSNDALLINGNSASGGPRFNGDVSTSYDPGSGNRWVSATWATPNPDSPVVASAGDPRYADPLTLPPSNVEIKNLTNPGPRPGCLFTGPTAIRLNNNGTMDVVSPFTKVVNCTWIRTPTTSLNDRYTITRFTIPSSTDPARLPVVYVQNVPSSGDNFTNGCPYSRPAIGGNGGSGLTPNRTHPLGFPQKNDETPSTTGTTPTGYGCRNGDVFLQGVLNGRLTIAAENNINLVGSTTYYDSDDLLGLIANNFISVYHPVASTTAPADAQAAVNEVQTITASRLTSSGTFTLTFCNPAGSCQTTGSITFSNTNSTTASNIATALGALSFVGGSGNVQVAATGGSGTGPRTFTVTFVNGQGGLDVNPTMTGSRMGITCGSGCGSPSVVETTKGAPADAAAPTCAGATVGGYCNLRVPATSTTATAPTAAPSLFNGTSPGTSSMTTLLGANGNQSPTISAPLLTVAHSVIIQFPNSGAPLGTLTVSGAIAQRYRGTVGAFNSSGTLVSGYAKSYMYDQRLKYDSPPYFLDPVKSAWQVVTWAERSAEYDASS